MAFDVSWIYQIRDQYTAPLKKIINTTTQARRAFGSVSRSIKKVGHELTSLRTIISASYGLAAISFPIKKAADFEEAMIDVRRIVDFKTEDAFKTFREGIIKTAVYLGKAPVDIAKIAYEAAKLTGTSDELNQFVQLASEAATAFDLDAIFSGETIGRLKTRFKMSIEETRKFLDAINYLGDRSATTGQKIIKTLGYGASAFANLKMPRELAAGWAAISSAVVETPRKAASAFKILTEDMMRMGRFRNKMIKAPHETIMNLLKKLNKMGPKRASMYVDRLFSKPAARLLKLLSQNMQEVDRMFGMVKPNVDWRGSMLKELNKKLDSTNTALGRIMSIADTAFIGMGDALLPIIKDVAPRIVEIGWAITDFIKKHPDLVKVGMAVIGIAAGLATITVIAGLVAIAIGTIISPAALVITGIIAIGTAFYMLYQKSEGVRRAVGRIWKALKPARKLFSAITDELSALFEQMGGFEGVAKAIENTIIWVLNSIANDIRTITEAIQFLYSEAESIYEKVSKIFDSKTYSKRIKSIQDSVSDNIINPISNIGSQISESISSGFDSALSLFGIDSNQSNYNPNNINVAAENAVVSKNRLDGEIVVSATKNSEVKRVNFHNDSPGRLGVNMAR